MATDKGYTTEGKIETYLNIAIDSADIQQFILAAQEVIDDKTGRNFKADTAASSRLYDGDGTDLLIIDDCIEVTKVEIGNDDYGANFIEISGTGADRYFVEPANHDARGVPIQRIRLRSRHFLPGVQNQRISAKWGYSEDVPEAISFVATVLAAGMYNFNRGGTGNVVTEKIGNYSVTYDRDSANALADYTEALRVLDTYKRYHL